MVSATEGKKKQGRWEMLIVVTELFTDISGQGLEQLAGASDEAIWREIMEVSENSLCNARSTRGMCRRLMWLKQ